MNLPVRARKESTTTPKVPDSRRLLIRSSKRRARTASLPPGMTIDLDGLSLNSSMDSANLPVLTSSPSSPLAAGFTAIRPSLEVAEACLLTPLDAARRDLRDAHAELADLRAKLSLAESQVFYYVSREKDQEAAIAAAHQAAKAARLRELAAYDAVKAADAEAAALRRRIEEESLMETDPVVTLRTHVGVLSQAYKDKVDQLASVSRFYRRERQLLREEKDLTAELMTQIRVHDPAYSNPFGNARTPRRSRRSRRTVDSAPIPGHASYSDSGASSPPSPRFDDGTSSSSSSASAPDLRASMQRASSSSALLLSTPTSPRSGTPPPEQPLAQTSSSIVFTLTPASPRNDAAASRDGTASDSDDDDSQSPARSKAKAKDKAKAKSAKDKAKTKAKAKSKDKAKDKSKKKPRGPQIKFRKKS